MRTIRSARWLLIGLFTAGIPLSPCSLRGQEPNGLQAAAAVESALVDAIASSEKSVVAITRADVDETATSTGSPASLKVAPVENGFGDQRIQSRPSPGDPDFIPDAYATGVVVDRHGLILTYYHALRQKSRHYVTTADRRVYAARIKAADPRSDLAILEIEADHLTPIKFGDAAGLRKGQIVVALGNPFAIARDGQASASWGIISNLRARPRPIRAPPTQQARTSSTISAR